MTVTVMIDHPDFPDDYEFGISDLGVLKNRSAVEVSEEQEQTFVSARRGSVKDILETEGSMFTVEGEPTAEVPEEENGEESEEGQEEGTTEQEAPTEEDQGNESA